MKYYFQNYYFGSIASEYDGSGFESRKHSLYKMNSVSQASTSQTTFMVEDEPNVSIESDSLQTDVIDPLLVFRIDWSKLSKRRKDMNALFNHMRAVGLQIINLKHRRI